jgi:hypothetical protein
MGRCRPVLNADDRSGSITEPALARKLHRPPRERPGDPWQLLPTIGRRGRRYPNSCHAGGRPGSARPAGLTGVSCCGGPRDARSRLPPRSSTAAPCHPRWRSAPARTMTAHRAPGLGQDPWPSSPWARCWPGMSPRSPRWRRRGTPSRVWRSPWPVGNRGMRGTTLSRQRRRARDAARVPATPAGLPVLVGALLRRAASRRWGAVHNTL